VKRENRCGEDAVVAAAVLGGTVRCGIHHAPEDGRYYNRVISNGSVVAAGYDRRSQAMIVPVYAAPPAIIDRRYNLLLRL